MSSLCMRRSLGEQREDFAELRFELFRRPWRAAETNGGRILRRIRAG